MRARWLTLTALLLGSAAAAQAPLLSTRGRLPAASAGASVPPSIGHTVQLARGQRVRISAASDDFDTVLRLYQPGKAEPIAENDDFEGSLNSRLLFTAPEFGEYRIEVSAFSSAASGAYSVVVSPAPALPPPVTEAATLTASIEWRRFEGALTAEDPEGEDGRFDDFQLTLAEGQSIVILLDAVEGAFDPIVHVHDLAGRESAPIATNDDAGAGLSSRLLFTAPAAGDYIVRVAAFSGGTGRYLLRVGDVASPD